MTADELVKRWPCEGCPLHHIGRAAPDADEPPVEWCEQTGQSLDCDEVDWVERIASIALQTAEAVRRTHLAGHERRKIADALGSALDGLMDDATAELDERAFRAACGLTAVAAR